MQTLTKTCQQCHKPMNGGLYRASHVCPHCEFEHEGGKRSRKYKAAPKLAHTFKEPLVQAPETEQTTPTAAVDVKPAVNASEAEKTSSTAITAEMPAIEDATDAAPTTRAIEPIAPKPVEPAPASEAVEPTKAQPAAAKAKPTQKASKAQPKSTPVSDDAVVLTTKSSKAQTVLALMDEVSSECVQTIALTPELFSGGKFIGQKSAVVKSALKQGKQDALTQLRQAAYDLDANMVTDVAVKNSMKVINTESAKVIVTATGNAIVAELYEEAYEA